MGICRNHMHRCHLLVINRYRWSAMWIFAMRMRMRMLVDKFVDLVRSHIDIVANFMKGAFIMPTPQPCIHIMVVGAFPTFTFVIPNILNVGGQNPIAKIERSPVDKIERVGNMTDSQRSTIPKSLGTDPSHRGREK